MHFQHDFMHNSKTTGFLYLPPQKPAIRKPDS